MLVGHRGCDAQSVISRTGCHSDRARNFMARPGIARTSFVALWIPLPTLSPPAQGASSRLPDLPPRHHRRQRARARAVGVAELPRGVCPLWWPLLSWPRSSDPGTEDVATGPNRHIHPSLLSPLLQLPNMLHPAQRRSVPFPQPRLLAVLVGETPAAVVSPQVLAAPWRVRSGDKPWSPTGRRWRLARRRCRRYRPGYPRRRPPSPALMWELLTYTSILTHVAQRRAFRFYCGLPHPVASHNCGSRSDVGPLAHGESHYTFRGMLHGVR